MIFAGKRSATGSGTVEFPYQLHGEGLLSPPVSSCAEKEVKCQRAGVCWVPNFRTLARERHRRCFAEAGDLVWASVGSLPDGERMAAGRRKSWQNKHYNI